MSNPTNLDLSSLNGSNGFKLSGVAANDWTGSSVASAGDVNGDGLADLIVSAMGSNAPGFLHAGVTYVVFGNASGFAGNFDLSSLDGSNGFKLSGVAEANWTGNSVASAGDVNGDGFADLIVGANSADPHGDGSGESYVVFGKASGFAANLNLSSLDGSNGFKLSGVAGGNALTGGDWSGFSVASAGDVNGDGFADLIIGAPHASANSSASGATYVVFGKASGFAANLDLSSLNGSNGFKLSGVSADDCSGNSVASAGDVNGDGFADLIIGASEADPHGSASGASYVVFGKASGFAANLDLSSLNGSNGFKLSGATADDWSGYSVASAGDLNGDGFADLIIGAPDPDSSSGASYVVFGKASGFAANLELSSLNGSNGFKLSGATAGDWSGYSVASAGDVNGDGFADLIIGATHADPHGSASGASYVVFGKASGFGASFNLSGLNGSNGFKLSGGAANDWSGNSVASAGDVNGDGFADLVVGAPYADPHGTNSGESYVVYGLAPDAAVDRTGTGASQTLASGAFDDILSGLGGDDRLFGNGGNDILNGGDGDDLLNGGLGNDRIDGGDGVDVATFGGERAAYQIWKDNGLVYVSGQDGVDVLTNVEQLAFSDTSLLVGAIDDPSDDVVTIETSGATRLDQVANEFYLRDSAGNGPSLKHAGADVIAGQFGAWTPVGAEKVGSGYQVVWKNGGADQYIVWNVDSNGNATSYATGVLSGSEHAFQSLETPFQQDFNADGTTGLKTTAIETSGATHLDHVANEFYLRDGTGNGPSLKYAGADVIAGQFGTWTPVGAEKVGSGYQVVWKYGGGDQYIVWNVDSSGNATSYATGVMSGSEYAFQSLETPFQQDFNTDGTTGLKTTVIETSGGTRLDQVANEFYLRDGTGNGPSLKVAGADVIAGQFGTWMPVGAEKVGSGYQVVWKNGGGDQYIVWNVDSSGNATSYATGVMSGSEYAFQSLETPFQQDFNTDGTTGLKTMSLETSGGTRLDQVANEFYLRDGAGNGPSLKYAGADVIAGQFGLWMPLGVEKVGSGYQVVWKNGSADQYIVWNVDSSGNCTNYATGVVPGSDPSIQFLETAFQQDLNGDGGTVAFAISALGADKAEGNSGTTPFTFTVTRTGDTGAAHSVSWSLTGSGANPASASDFVGNALPNGTVSFAAGETSKTVTVNIAGDTGVESDEGLTVTLSSPSAGTTLGTASAIGTIRNDDAVLSIATASADNAEGQSGTTPFTFTITRTGDTGSVHNVSWSLAGSGANPASASDFMGNALPSGTVSFAAGETSKTVTVNVAGDTGVESDEGFTVTLSSPSAGATLGTASAIGTIRTDDTSSPGTGGDNTAPALQSISLSTSQLNIGSGQTSLVVTAHLSDDISGLSDGIGGLQPNIVFRSPSGAQVWASFDIQHPVSGNQLDGTFRATVQLPANAEAGNWTVDYLVVADEAGNTKFLHPSDTPALSSATFQVLNSASDGAAPVLQSISLSTSQLNIGSGQTSLVVTAHLSDDISGLSDGIGGLQPNIVFRSPSGAQVWASFDIQHPVSGNQLDGTFRATVQLPANAEAGNWTVDYLVVADEAGNTKFLHPSDTPALNSATFQVLNSASHSAVFSVESVQAGQSEGQSITTADTFTATLGEDHGGVPTPGDGQSHDSHDGATALSSDGSTVIVGSWSDDVGANTDQGSAQVFVRDGSDWTQRGAALTASDGQAEDLFGWSVALSSDGRTAIVGGPGDDVGEHADQGSARVLAWDGNAWTQRGSAITPGDGHAGDHFGASVALSSDGLTVVIGSPQDNVGANIDQGAAYVFTWDGGEWTQRGDALTFSDGGSGSHLGSSVAFSSDGLTVTVGAGGDSAPLVFHWDGSHWI